MNESVSHTTFNKGFPKEAHLKSRKAIDALFRKNLSVKAYPLRAVYDIADSSVAIDSSHSLYKAGFSVPKRNFSRATDRNLLKRRMREAFRTHNSGLKKNLSDIQKHMQCMILFTGKEISDSRTITTKMKVLIKQLEDVLD